jgi:hypothetical protein
MGGFLIIASPLSFSQRVPLAELALKHRLPGMFGSRETVEAGGLMSYGPDYNDLHRGDPTGRSSKGGRRIIFKVSSFAQTGAE